MFANNAALVGTAEGDFNAVFQPGTRPDFNIATLYVLPLVFEICIETVQMSGHHLQGGFIDFCQSIGNSTAIRTMLMQQLIFGSEVGVLTCRRDPRLLLALTAKISKFLRPLPVEWQTVLTHSQRTPPHVNRLL